MEVSYFKYSDDLNIQKGPLVIRSAYAKEKEGARSALITLGQGNVRQLLNDLLPEGVMLLEIFNEADEEGVINLNQEAFLYAANPEENIIGRAEEIAYPRRVLHENNDGQDMVPFLTIPGSLLTLLYLIGVARSRMAIHDKMLKQNRSIPNMLKNKKLIRAYQQILERMEEGVCEIQNITEKRAVDTLMHKPRREGAAFAEKTIASYFEAGIDAEPEMTCYQVTQALARINNDL